MSIAACYVRATSLIAEADVCADLDRSAAAFNRAADEIEKALDRDPRSLPDVLQQFELALVGAENARDELHGPSRVTVDGLISAVHGALRLLPQLADAGGVR